MKKLFILLGLTATSFANPVVHDDDMKLLWGAWKDHHSRGYSEHEEPNRYGIFSDNYNKIIAHNANNSDVTLALNEFADLTHDEFKSQMTGGFKPSSQPDESNDQGGRNLRGGEDRNLGSLPAYVDWRAKGAVGPVKNQGQCNGCWSFATSGALEALNHIKKGVLLSFSEQQLLDCDHMSSNGCNEGNYADAFIYTQENGIELESTYPFQGRNGVCRFSASRAYKVNTGSANVQRNSASALMAAIVNQPVAVAIDSKSSVFQFYRSGVVSSGCGNVIDHAVLAVGYTTVNGKQAFIVKNSWGSGWGMSGFLYISTSGSGSGTCGILTQPAHPI